MPDWTCPPAGAQPIHHSDRGTQYCLMLNPRSASRFTYSIHDSKTESHHCAENALAEGVNGIVKSEYLLGWRFRSKQDARRAVQQAIGLYNTRRPHRALGNGFRKRSMPWRPEVGGRVAGGLVGDARRPVP